MMEDVTIATYMVTKRVNAKRNNVKITAITTTPITTTVRGITKHIDKQIT